MSAVVAILNKQAIAVAADSAVSVNGKVFNRALKIFTLSKHHPIGIMIYSSAEFMGIPWETIIKMYRTQLAQTSFDTVAEYKEDFVSYLQVNGYFISIDSQKEYLLQNLYYHLFSNIYNTARSFTTDNSLLPGFISNEADNLLTLVRNNTSIINHFAHVTADGFNAELEPTFELAIQLFFTNSGIILTEDILNKLKEICYNIFIKQEQFTHYSGLVFVGFGNTQIFPSLKAINIHYGFNNWLKHYETDTTTIELDMNSAIRPFAQTEVMNTILTGIAPNLETQCNENFGQYLIKYNQLLINTLKHIDPQIEHLIQSIDVAAQKEEFAKSIGQLKLVQYIQPLVGAVSNLSKEDLAELAESLIYLTYLQKRITFATEDVGGAVDVAVISKGDGFIWIKRKHYFQKELNQHFYDNYL